MHIRLSIVCALLVPVLLRAQYADLYITNHSSYQVSVSVDGWDQGSIWTGATSRITVSVGYHNVSIEEYEYGDVYWGPWDIEIDENGYEITLYDPPGDEDDYTTMISNLYVVNESNCDARIYVDGWEKGTAVAGGTFTTTIQGGYSYECYAEECYSAEYTWGPETFYIPEGETYTWTLLP